MMNRPPTGNAAATIWPHILIPYLISRFGILCTGVLALSFGQVRSGNTWRVPSHAWVDMWARWDSGFYLQIAAQGYRHVDPSSVAFFPLYPMLMRVLAFGSQDWVTLVTIGWVLSNVSTVLGLVYLYKLIILDAPERTAKQTIWCMLFCPTSFFFSMVYTEGLFLLLTVAAFYCARRKRWAAACILGGLSAATRAIGVLLVLPLAYEWFLQRPRSSRGSGLYLLLVPCGLGGYMLYLYTAFGDPLVFAKAHASWGRVISLSGAWQRITTSLADPMSVDRLLGASLDLAFILVGGVLFLGLLRRVRFSYVLYSAYAIGVPLATLLPMSMPRLLIVAFPLFIVLAEWLHTRVVFYAVISLAYVLQLVFVARWSLWYWLA
jgi:Gpi18-like mannosyltransferase